MTNQKKEALIAEILAARSGAGTHCSNCGHCTATL